MVMELRNCPECGKIFTFIKTNLCPECKQKLEDQFETVKQYLAENPKANIQQVSEGTDIPEKTIAGYLRDGRIIASSENKNLGLTCELCGEPITTGRFCYACSQKLTDGFRQSVSEINKKKAEEIAQEKNKPEWARSRFSKY
jgi:flagellar operon protein (TIGR03826 family)